MKTCTKCGETKELEAFTRSKRCKDGYLAQCKGCRNAARRESYHRQMQDPTKRGEQRRRLREWEAAHPEDARKRTQQWRKRNPELARQKSAEASRQLRERDPDYFNRYYHEHAEVLRERARLHMARSRKERPDRERERKRRYRQANTDLVREREREKTYRRRAQIAASPATARYMTRLLQEPCAYCGTTENITVDHIVPLVRGGKHEPANLAPACKSCNSSKCALLLDEWSGPAV